MFEARYWQQVNLDLFELSGLVRRAAEELIEVPVAAAVLSSLLLPSALRGSAVVGDQMTEIEKISERSNKTMATLAEITAKLGSLGELVGGRVDFLIDQSPPPSEEGGTT